MRTLVSGGGRGPSFRHTLQFLSQLDDDVFPLILVRCFRLKLSFAQHVQPLHLLEDGGTRPLSIRLCRVDITQQYTHPALLRRHCFLYGRVPHLVVVKLHNGFLAGDGLEHVERVLGGGTSSFARENVALTNDFGAQAAVDCGNLMQRRRGEGGMAVNNER